MTQYLSYNFSGLLKFCSVFLYSSLHVIGRKVLGHSSISHSRINSVVLPSTEIVSLEDLKIISCIYSK